MSLLSTLLSGYGAYDQYKNISDLQKQQQQYISGLTPQLTSQVQFKPFTVTSSLAGATTTPTGGFATTLSPEQQALQNQLFSGAAGMFGQAMGDTAGREADVYERIRALQTPSEQRQRLATEERMAAQGRLGLSSNAYGGSTPELLAQEEALSQARNQAALSAIQQAQAEQAQAAKLGQGFMQAGYAPEAQALNLLGAGTNLAQLAGAGQQQAASLMAQLGLGGLQQQTLLEQQRNDLLRQLYSGLAGATSGVTSSSGGMLGGLEGILGDIIGLFGGGSSGNSQGTYDSWDGSNIDDLINAAINAGGGQ